jgi:hypothetical protein
MSDIDQLLVDMLEEDLLAVMLVPPRVPSFAIETLPPAKYRICYRCQSNPEGGCRDCGVTQ